MKQKYLFPKSHNNINTSFDAEDYFVSEHNNAVYNYINNWPNWTSRFLIICGDRGSGKTHLAHIWKEISHAHFLHIQDSNIIADLDKITHKSKSLIIDDAQYLKHEEQFLHFYNIAKEQNLWSLITSEHDPKNIILPDLRSRFLSLPIFHLKNPDTDLTKILLGKIFMQKQLVISGAIIEYIAKRIERSFLAVRKIAELVEEEVRLKNRKISINMIKQVMALSSPDINDK